MKKNSIQLIIFINSIALAGIILTQIYWVKESYRFKEEQFSNTIRLVIKSVSNQIQHYMLEYPKAEAIAALNDSALYLPDAKDINPNLLDLKIKEEIKCLQVGNEFEYAIIDSRNNSFLISNSDLYRAKLPNSKHQLPMTGFKDSEFIFFSFYFPDEIHIILKSMVNWLVFSLLFTIILLLGYFYTLYFFFRQKWLSEMKSDFINNMTHEFKTPLATISLAAEMLMKKAVQEDASKMQRYTRIIFDENSRLQNHVEQILRVSQLQKGKFRLRKKEVNVHELITKIVESFEITLKERGGDIKSHFCAKDFIVRADQAHITNVITNLLDNAEKYSLNKPQIKIGTYNDSHGVVISVEDKGIGISFENQRHIFKNLYRVPTGNIYNRDKGFGIGLYYVKTIVEAHGGHINLKSELGKGSRFDVFLPFLTNSTPDEHEESKET
jgi:two-component system, OmpR family, phosphate regulon sensor histidine kinase PhoR